MFKFFLHLIIVSIFFTFSSYAKNYEKIIINGNERISSETILVFSEISEDKSLNENSINDESFQNGLLEYPQFTKPQIWEKKSVPEVLLSGDHTKIKDWRLSQSKAITRDRRPDLWQKYKND